MHHHDLTSVPLPEQLSPNAELLDDLAELYKIFMVYYALADDHVRTIFAQGLDHILE